jgi:hypothetical protein
LGGGGGTVLNVSRGPYSQWRHTIYKMLHAYLTWARSDNSELAPNLILLRSGANDKKNRHKKLLEHIKYTVMDDLNRATYDDSSSDSSEEFDHFVEVYLMEEEDDEVIDEHIQEVFSYKQSRAIP